ncbi:hypothetical protein NQ315_017000 [Exocentrus adspersus]|uniref:Uncharacterized protein n=1 Tax=Exocentrus adspersus TaxID=1586481 RepID=A0AAV8VBK7_9CUCU|nr:hypothetical protein NQ315_017000 [Exocentrus adspersus]
MDKVVSPPKHGLKLGLDHVYPENRVPNHTPRLKILFRRLPAILRYIWYYIKSKLTGKSIVIDMVKPQSAQRIYGRSNLKTN